MRQSYPQGQATELVVEIDLKSGINLIDPACDLMKGQQSVGLRSSQNMVWQPQYDASVPLAQNGLGYPAVPVASDSSDTGGPYTINTAMPSHILGKLWLPNGLNRHLLVGSLNVSPYSVQVWRTYSVDTIYPQPICGGTSSVGGSATDSMLGLPIVQAYWRTANLNLDARDLDNDGNTTDPGETAISDYPRNGLLFFSHPGMSHIYMIDTNGNINTEATTPSPSTYNISKWYIRSYTNIDNDPDYSLHRDYAGMGANSPTVAPPAGASALKVYLDRLWMASPIGNFFYDTQEGRRSTVWYTDPFNWRSIRANNFFIVEDTVTAFAVPVSGGIGIGGQAQLVIFGINSISVLDGDPAQGNAYYRILVNDTGVISQKCVLETPYGIVLIATDNQVYLIPPGAQRLIPIGNNIQPVINRNRVLDISSIKPSAQLFWHTPYIYAVFDDLSHIYIFDLSTPDNPKWWGPIMPGTDRAVAKAFGDTCPKQLSDSSVTVTEFFTHKLTNPTSPVNIYKTELNTGNTINYIVGLSNQLVTGSINVPGHRVQLTGVIIQQARVATPPVLTVTATTAEGITTTGLSNTMPTPFPTPKTAGVPDMVNDLRYLDMLRYSFTHSPVISDSLSISIANTATGKEPYIQKAYATIRIQPAQW